MAPLLDPNLASFGQAAHFRSSVARRQQHAIGWRT
jgi:hypothetical protein